MSVLLDAADAAIAFLSICCSSFMAADIFSTLLSAASRVASNAATRSEEEGDKHALQSVVVSLLVRTMLRDGKYPECLGCSPTFGVDLPSSIESTRSFHCSQSCSSRSTPRLRCNCSSRPASRRDVPLPSLLFELPPPAYLSANLADGGSERSEVVSEASVSDTIDGEANGIVVPAA